MPLYVKISYRILFSLITVLLSFDLLSQTTLEKEKEYINDERLANTENRFKAILSNFPYVELERSNSSKIEKSDSQKLHRLVDGGLNYQKKSNLFSNNEALLLKNELKDDTLIYNQLNIVSGKEIEIQAEENKALKNQINMNYLHIDHDKYLYASSIYTLEYIRKEGNNTFVGRINATSRNSKMGNQGELDWYHVFKNKSYFMVNAGVSDRYFPKFKAGVSYYHPFKNAWVGEIGSRYFYDNIDDRSQFFGIIGIEKEFSNFWFNAKYTFGHENDFRNHLFLQARMFMKDEKSYATAMAGIGNMPEVNDLNYLAQNAYTIRNTMLGVGYTHFFSKNFLSKFLLNWYNYKVNENARSDQFHLLFSVGYLF